MRTCHRLHQQRASGSDLAHSIGTTEGKKIRDPFTRSSLHTSCMYNMVSHSLMTLVCLRLAKSLQSCQFCEPATFVSTSIFSQFSCDIRLQAPERTDKSAPRPPPLHPPGRPHRRQRRTADSRRANTNGVASDWFVIWRWMRAYITGGEDFSWKSCFTKRSGGSGRRGGRRWMKGHGG